jgi:biopolymer transport protein ExbB/TolQ
MSDAPQIRIRCMKCRREYRAAREGLANFRCTAGECGATHFRVIPRRTTGMLDSAPVTCALLPLFATVALYALAHPFRPAWCSELLWDRGWFQPVNTFAFFVGLSLLWGSYRYCRRQTGAQAVVDRIAAEVVPHWQDALDRQFEVSAFGPRGRWRRDQGHDLLMKMDELKLTAGAGASTELIQPSLYLSRLHRVAMYLFKTKAQNLAEMMDLNRDLSSLDGEQLNGQFTLVRYVAYLMPVIGFLGTVWGISQAIGGIGQTLPSVRDMDRFVVGMQPAMHALRVAFDTTLLALLYSGLLTFFLTLATRRSEAMLSDLDRWILDNVISHIVETNLAERTLREGFVLLAGTDGDTPHAEGLRGLSDRVQNLSAALSGAPTPRGPRA